MGMGMLMMEACVLTLKTSMSGRTLERLLGTACRGAFTFGFDGCEETSRGERKIIWIAFENGSDRERFRVALRHLAQIAPRYMAREASPVGLR